MKSWLVCKAMPGMFPREYAVVVATLDGEVSFFLSGGDLRLPHGLAGDITKGVEAQILVELLEKAQGFGLVALPVQPIEGTRVTRVDQRLLRAE